MRTRAGRIGIAGLMLAAAAWPAAAQGPGSGVDVAAMDRSVRPGDDFDSFASGGWRTRAVIAPDKQGTGTIEDMNDTAQARLRGLVEAAATMPPSHDARLVGDLYAAFMDEAAVVRLGDTSLRADLARLGAVTDKAAMAAYMAATQSGFGRGVFVCDVWVDLKHPDRPALRLRQDGLGLDYREAYDDAATVAAYRAYAARMLALAGWADAEAEAGRIMQMEQRIAAASWTIAQNSDRVKRYNPMSLAELLALAPGFDWAAYFHALGADGVQPIFVQQKSAIPAIAEVFADTPLATLKAWEAFQIVDAAAPYLPPAYGEARFAFRGKIVDGLDAPPPRWKQGVDTVSAMLSEPLGHLYVDRYLAPRARARVEAMGAEFKAAMAGRIRSAGWMAPQTRATALAKLERVRFLIGAPRRWRDFSPLNLSRTDLYGDVVKARAFAWAGDAAKLSGPADPEEWFLPPQTVDAFSDQPRVAIGVPAGILQPPIFDPAAEAAANYGTLGEVMGHELTHQFDDQGRKYGPDGALADWWTPADAARFEAEARRLAAQFDAIEPLPGMHLNGSQTLSENIADLGGLVLALDAYHLSLHGRPAPVIDGLTGDQRVFLGWARVFRSKERPESIRNQVAGGTHTPFRFRAMAPMRNIDAWYAAFDVRPGQTLYLAPDQRVRIW